MIRTRTRRLLRAVIQNLDQPEVKIAGGLLALTAVVHPVLQMQPLSVGLLVTAVGLGTWGILKEDSGTEIDEDALIEEVNQKAERWMNSVPLRQPDPDTFPEGSERLTQVNATLRTEDLSENAIRFLLLLAIQYGSNGRWWDWFERARDLRDIPDILTVPLATAGRGWIRVAARAAYLMQCLPTEAIDEAVERQLRDPVKQDVSELIEAAKQGTVRLWVKQYGLEAGAQAGKFMQLEQEFSQARFLGCE